MPSEDSAVTRRIGRSPPSDLEEAVDCYLERLASGSAPDPETFIADHPEIADELRGVFRVLEFVESTSRSLNASSAPVERLGDFRIVREIGRGGMGAVYEAVQSSLDRRVALKILPAASMLYPNATERFEREASTASRLHHSNIVPVYAVGEDHGVLYYAMQYIEGPSLGQHVAAASRDGFVPDRDWCQHVAAWCLQVAEALAYAHRMGTIHRDVKPSNLLLDAQDNVWLTDFGLARTDAMASLTLSGDVIGTARYMSPEQARGGPGPVDARTDVYSLGATLYELVALEPAFDGESREEVLGAVLTREPTPLARVCPAVPKDLATIAAKCMAKERERRYASAGDLAADLRRFVEGRPILARRPSVLQKAARFVRRHPLHTAGTVVALVFGTLALVLVLQLRRVQADGRLEEALDQILVTADQERAMRLLDEAEALGNDSVELQLYRGLVPLLNGRPAAALPALERAVADDPDHVECIYALAYARIASGDRPAGERLLQRAVGREVSSALAWFLRGLALGLLEAGDEVIECYNRAITRRRDFSPAIEARAHYRVVQVQVEGDTLAVGPMLADFDALVVFRPTSARAYATRAMGLWVAAASALACGDRPAHEQRLAEARSAFDRALSLRAPGEGGVLARHGAFLRYVGDIRGSVRAFTEAIDAAGDEPGLVAFRHQRALSLQAMGELEGALEDLERVAPPGDAPFPLDLQRAIVLAELGRLDEACGVARAAFERGPGDASSRRFAVAVVALLGDVTENPPSPGADPTPGEVCVASFDHALFRLGHGDRAGGLEALERCLATGVTLYAQHRFALVLRRRIDNDPRWPPWVPLR